jgi:transmembrane sensor
MTSAPESAEARASREASAWLIELQEHPDDAATRRRLGEWIASGAENARAWASVQQLAQVARAMTPELAAEWRPALRQVRAAEAARTDTAPRMASGRRWRMGAAALAMAACIALVAGPGLMMRLQSDALTDTAEIRRLDLPDGSQVTLAAGSAVALEFARGDRRVRLLKGEAFFQVVPDPSRPFRVIADDVETTVLGTQFDVRRDPAGVTVSVEEGRVAVSATAKPAAVETLGAGDAVRMSWKGEAVRSTVPAQLIAAWRQGQLILHDRPLGDAVDQLRRYYGGVIVIAGDALAKKPVTGAYNLHDPEDALRGMARAHGATVRRISPWLIVMSDN